MKIADLNEELGGEDPENNLAQCRLKLDRTGNELSDIQRQLALLTYDEDDANAPAGDRVNRLMQRQADLKEEQAAQQRAWQKALELNNAISDAHRQLELKVQDSRQVRAVLNSLATRRTSTGSLERLSEDEQPTVSRLGDQRPWLMILVIAAALAAGRIMAKLTGGKITVALRGGPGYTRPEPPAGGAAAVNAHRPGARVSHSGRRDGLATGRADDRGG